MPDAAELLALFERSARGRLGGALPDGMTVERDGPLLRLLGPSEGGFVEIAEPGAVDDDDLGALIDRQVRFFAARGEPFEWKTWAHDPLPGLPARLAAAGFLAGDTETLVIGPVDAVAAEPQPPEGVTLREVREQSDLDRIGELERAVWGEDAGVAADLAAEIAADPDALAVVVAEAGGTVVCAAWIRFAHGTALASLWGGATRPAWRRRGIYRATVAHRARLAAARGFGYLTVDASEESRPILERLGFVGVTTTTPYRWSPRPR